MGEGEVENAIEVVLGHVVIEDVEKTLLEERPLFFLAGLKVTGGTSGGEFLEGAWTARHLGGPSR